MTGAPTARASRLPGLVLVLLVALVVRAAYLVELRGAPDFEHPAVDAGFHDDWARTLAGDPDWQRPAHRPDPGFERNPYFRPPGYPYLLALVYRLSDGSYLAARVVNVLLGLASVFLLWRLGTRLVGPATGLGAALLLALDPVAVYFEGELHAVTPFVTLLLLAANLAAAWRERGGAGRALGLGLVLGLAALFRPNALALAGVTALWMVLSGPRRAWRPGLLLALGTVLALVPSTLRNWRVSGEPIPITTNLGINLWLGNNPTATGQVSASLPGIGTFETCYDYPAVANRLEQLEGRELSPSEVSAWFTARALEWIAAEPLAFLGLCLHKLGLFLGPADITHNKVVALEREHFAALRWLPGRFPVLLVLAVAGLVLALRERRHALLLPLAWAAVYCASVLPFFVAARYRLPVEPFLALPAGYLLARLLPAGSRPGRRELLPCLAAGLAAALALALWPVRVEVNRAKWHVDRALALAAGEDLEGALAEYGRALEAAPLDAHTHYLRAVALGEAGRLAEARAGYERSLELEPDYPRAWNNLALARLSGGDLPGAMAAFERATELEPSYLLAWTNLAAAAWSAGRTTRALEACRAALELDPRHAEMRRMLARGLARTGEEAGAAEVLEALVAEHPEDVQALLELAWIRAAAEDAGVRDPARARDLARRVEQALGPRWDALELRALAEAAAGDTGAAAALAERALAAAPPARRPRLESALAAYRAGRPFRAPR